jgi:hypothetical protein
LSEEPTALDRCLALQATGGGRVNVKLASDGPSIEGNFAEEWVIQHLENLGVLILDLPPHACFTLMHPGIEHWEGERQDFITLSEEE